LIAEIRKKVPRNIRIPSFFNNLYPRAVDPDGNAVFSLTGNRTAMATDATPEIDDHPILFLFNFAFFHLYSTAVYFLQDDLSIGEFIYI
jgi:hypothetical protein